MTTKGILADLSFDDYFFCDCVPAILKSLRYLTSSSSDIVKLRGSRFANCKCQAEILVELGKDDSNEVATFFKYVAKNLWTITFVRDHLLSFRIKIERNEQVATSAKSHMVTFDPYLCGCIHCLPTRFILTFSASKTTFFTLDKRFLSI